MTTSAYITILASLILAFFMLRRPKNKAANLTRGKDIDPKSPPKELAQLPDEIKQAIADGKKLEAIKLYRQYTGCTLAQAQQIIESLS